MLKKISLFFICIACLTGCVTPYQPNGLAGGYSDMALAPDIYKVSFNGNGYTSAERVHSYLLRRCAEIALRENYDYFVILNGASNTEKSYLSSPTYINSRNQGNLTDFGSNQLNYSGSSNTTIDHGSVYEMNRYSATVIIKLLKTNKNAPFAFKAATILANSFS